MKVLLTGGAGFIGRPVRDRLCASGHEVVIFDRVLDPRDDITSLPRLAKAMRGCDAVVHLAAKVGLGADIADITDYVLQNDYGTAVLLRCAAAAGVGRLVYASSMVVYGEGAYACDLHGPIRPPPRHAVDLKAGRFEPRCPECGGDLTPGFVAESAALDPRTSYAATKVHGEHLAAVWSRETGGSVAALRFHNVYGPGMPLNTPYAGVAALFRSSLARGEAPRVFEDGKQRRNFIHVFDVAAAVVATVELPLTSGLLALNIGTPWVSTIGDLAGAMSRSLVGPEPVVTGQYRLGDVRHITADCRAAERVLGWRAEIDLQQGVADLI